MQTNLEQFREIIRSFPLEDFNKLREIVEEEIAKRGMDENLQYEIERHKKALES